MKFFYADSQDLVDPNFDFQREQWSPDRLRHRDDAYAHELFSDPPYDGLLVSKAIVDGTGNGSRYTLAQRHRFYREGVRRFFRIPDDWVGFDVIGDCGAFSYVKEPVPPFTPDDVLDFYESAGFDRGLSVDHAILEYQPNWDAVVDGVPAGVRDRRELTLRLAEEFLRRHAQRNLNFIPIGVAQGWSPRSYADSVVKLQEIGFDYIALGGMVPLKTAAILEVLEHVAQHLAPSSRLHLLGVTRVEQVNKFASFGVVSFDTTSPLRQAFKDDRDNYWTADSTYTAIRIPQIQGNPSLMRNIRAGLIRQEEAARLERASLTAMDSYSKGAASIDSVVSTLREYERLYDPAADHTPQYARTLADKPWTHCTCDVCVSVGHHVILFRGAERNRRRGFHNLWTFRRRLHTILGSNDGARAAAKSLAEAR
jgi:hypothetical protein